MWIKFWFFSFAFLGVLEQLTAWPVGVDRPSSAQKVCLVMTTSNDERVVGECLQSVKKIVDCVVICDLGSNDQTRSIIENFFREEKIPGAIVFEKNAVSTATKIVQSLGWNLTQTFLLVLRPDAVCEIGAGFSKADLKRDAYLVLEPSEDFSHYSYKPNFLRASIPWGVIKPYVSEHLKTFSWQVNPLETYHSKRIAQRIEELLNDVNSGSSDLNSLLTLAGLYRCINSIEQAISFYQKCAVSDERCDEVWFARYMLALCLDMQGDAKNALHWYLEAYRLRPDRMEPIAGLFMGQLPLDREFAFRSDIILN